jgi:DNA-binding response OmpR family regulator
MTRERARLLVVESDRELGFELRDQLVADGYPVELARSVGHARALALAAPPRLVLLGEIGSSNEGLRLLEEIRETRRAPSALWDPTIPVIVLRSCAGELDLLRAFDAGADDLLARPPSFLELRSRLQAVLRRAEAHRPTASVIEVDALAVDVAAHLASLEGRVLSLSPMEFDLLAQLAGEPDRVFRTDELLRIVWGYRTRGTTRTVASHASRLRKKLCPSPAESWIINVRGVGYRLR